MTVRDRLRGVLFRMEEAAGRSGRAPELVRLCIVSKRVPAETVREVVAAGGRILGENRVQDADEKIESLENLRSRVEWHMIGHLQTNKAKRAFGIFDVIQSVDSFGLAQKLNELAEGAGRPCRAYFEVKTSDEPSKTGIPWEAAPEVLAECFALPHLRPEGLMTMAPLAGNEAAARRSFRRLRELRDRLAQKTPGLGLSMGMSSDFEWAIEEGSTMVRVGTAIFG